MIKRFLAIVLVLSFIWHGVVWITNLPEFILPYPHQVLVALWSNYQILLNHTLVTAIEIILGVLIGFWFGFSCALSLFLFKTVRRWLLPIIILSQAVPVFALAPIFVLWFGYGLLSKLLITAIIIFFPITMTCFDGLCSTPKSFLELAHTMKLSRWQTLKLIQFPAALPSIGSGVRIAIVFAPIGAVLGEWVGSNAGLGYYMLQANAKMQIDDMFASLLLLMILTKTLYVFTDLILRKIIFWNKELSYYIKN